MARLRENMRSFADRWFPSRQILIRGEDKITVLALSQRQQICGIAAIFLILGSTAGAGMGLALARAGEAKAARTASHLAAAQTEALATIHRVLAGYGIMAAERDEAVAQASQAQIQAQTSAQSSLATAASTAQLQQLLNQTQATITQVQTIIRSTGLDPAHLASEPAPGKTTPAQASAASAAPKPGQTGAELLQRDLGRLQSLSAVLAQLPLATPVAQITISSPFGYRPDPWTGQREFHVGIDITGPMGEGVYATAPGTVTYAGWETGYGQMVEISHGYGLTTRYSHLERIFVPVGAVVDAHQEIGQLGNTGWSTGPHLLYETRVDGQPQNPLNFMKVASNDVQN